MSRRLVGRATACADGRGLRAAAGVCAALVLTAVLGAAQDAGGGGAAGDDVPAPPIEAPATGAPPTDTAPVADDQSAADQAGDDQAGASTLPDPSTWVFDDEGRMSEWLERPRLDPVDLAARPDAYTEALSSHGIDLDLEGRVLALRGATLHDRETLRYPIEYLVVTGKGKTYEACVLIKAMPSVVDACLQAMGVKPGSPTTFTAKDPPPSDEELDAGVLPYTMTSAGGDVIDIVVTWVDDEGRPQRASLESLLVEWPAPELDELGEPVAGATAPAPKELLERGWVFCGSSFASYRQGRELIEWHRGDVEGDVIAIYLDGRRSCLVERNSVDGIDGSLYTLNPETMPPAGTPVTLLFTPRGERVEAREVDLGDRTPDALQGDPAAGR